MLEFYIVDTQAPPVLGLKSCLDLKLIKLVLSVAATKNGKNAIMAEYAGVFEGIRLLPGEYTFHLDPTVTPVVCPPRRVSAVASSRSSKTLKSQGSLPKLLSPLIGLML